MNPGRYTMKVPRGGRFDLWFNLKDSANQPVPLAGFIPVLNLYRDGELVGSSLPNDTPDLWDVDLDWEPDDADGDPIIGRVQITIGSDVTSSWLVPLGQADLGMNYRLELLDDSLATQTVLLMTGPIQLLEEF